LDLSQHRFDRILDLVYDTLENKGAWRPLLDCLNEALDTRAVHLLAFDKRNGSLSYSDGADMAPQIDMEYIQTYQFIDPRVALLRTLEDGSWLHCHEHFDEQFAATHPFYQDFLLPHGARYLSACKLADSDAAAVLLAFLRRPEDGPMPEESLAFLSRLTPHLRRAVRIGESHFVYSAQALVGHALVNKLHQPVMLLSVHGDVVQTNQACSRLLDTTTLIGVHDGRLVMPEGARERFLADCAQLEAEVRFGGGPDGGGDAPFRSIHLASRDGAAEDTLYGFFNMLVPEKVMGTFGLRPLVMLFLYHPRSAQVIDTSLLSAAFGLSHAECRVATLLADGVPLKEIAEQLGIQYDTVRKQLHSIYTKTATNRQPELVRLLLHLPAAAVKREVALVHKENK
jgi:DNA-binding CsgD family transcriptional regulator